MADKGDLLNLRASGEFERFDHVLHEQSIPELRMGQMARRLLRLCREPIGDYDLFDRYMESFGRLSFYEPMQKVTIRATLVSLLDCGLLSQDGDLYVASPEALGQVKPFDGLDGTPEMAIDLLRQLPNAGVLIAQLSFSTSTSTSCKCTSTSSSSAQASAIPVRAGGRIPLAEHLCIAQAL